MQSSRLPTGRQRPLEKVIAAPDHIAIPATPLSLEAWNNSPFRLAKNENAWHNIWQLLQPDSAPPKIDFASEQLITVWTHKDQENILPWAYAADGSITIILKHDAYARADYSKCADALAEATEFRIYRIPTKNGGVSTITIEQPRKMPPSDRSH